MVSRKPGKQMDQGKTKIILSTLWIFVTVNYLYCDILTLMDPSQLKQIISGTVGIIHMTEGFLLGAAILMEIPIAMILLSRILKYSVNRWLNISAGIIMTAVQTASLFVGKPTYYYSFFSMIEIATTIIIMWYSWKWRTCRDNEEKILNKVGVNE